MVLGDASITKDAWGCLSVPRDAEHPQGSLAMLEHRGMLRDAYASPRDAGGCLNIPKDAGGSSFSLNASANCLRFGVPTPHFH